MDEDDVAKLDELEEEPDDVGVGLIRVVDDDEEDEDEEDEDDDDVAGVIKPPVELSVK